MGGERTRKDRRISQGFSRQLILRLCLFIAQASYPSWQHLNPSLPQDLEARELVPGDIISIRLGDILPADCLVLEGEELKIDQSMLTGESMPVTRGPGALVYSGSVVKTGEAELLVVGTGLNTFFGKAFSLVAGTASSGHFQKVMNTGEPGGSSPPWIEAHKG